jgi:hypothetical protein
LTSSGEISFDEFSDDGAPDIYSSNLPDFSVSSLKHIHLPISNQNIIFSGDYQGWLGRFTSDLEPHPRFGPGGAMIPQKIYLKDKNFGPDIINGQVSTLKINYYHQNAYILENIMGAYAIVNRLADMGENDASDIIRTVEISLPQDEYQPQKFLSFCAETKYFLSGTSTLIGRFDYTQLYKGTFPTKSGDDPNSPQIIDLGLEQAWIHYLNFLNYRPPGTFDRYFMVLYEKKTEDPADIETIYYTIYSLLDFGKKITSGKMPNDF